MSQAVFYKHFAADPYYNMAFDEWLFARACDNDGSIFLRLYSWNKGAVTFGFNQNEQMALDFSKLNGTPAIRRITGGRALYHDTSELTYSIAINTNRLENEMLNRSTAQALSSIAGVLVSFLTEIGIKSDYLRQTVQNNNQVDFFHKAPCFDSRAKYEIVSDSQKVIASAQRRIESTIFQHGSIKLKGVAPHPAITHSNSNCMSQKELPPITEKEFKRLEEPFVNVFSNFFECTFNLEMLTEREKEQLENRIFLVKKNSTDRRIFFKQNWL